MRIAEWPCGDKSEYALTTGDGSGRPLLIIPALLDEANKLRRFTLDMMRALAEMRTASVLIDLPGCNESLAPLSQQTLTNWREAARNAASHFEASAVLTIRGGAIVAPDHLPLVSYAPVAGQTILRAMLRAAVLSEREAGREITREALLERGLQEGLMLAGHSLNAQMLAELAAAQPSPAHTIAQSELGRPALWLRAEPGDDPVQAAQLAALVAAAL